MICLSKGVLQPTLEEIRICSCTKLKTLTPVDKTQAAFNGPTSLQRLWIHNCPEFDVFTERAATSNPCRYMVTRLSKVKTPNPDALRSLTSSKELRIISCPNWGSCWEEGLFCTTSLQTLYIGEFGENYRHLPWPSTSTASQLSSHCTSLEYLTLWGWPEVKSLPDQLEHLPALCHLIILSFNGLESLPECLGKLSALQSLLILRCPLLEKRCKKGIGEDWHKIAHIPSTEIDGRTIV